MERSRHILFLGSGRSTMHLMAEVQARRILETQEGEGQGAAGALPGGVAVLSASMTPFGVDPLAAEVLSEVGLDLGGLPLRTPEDVDVFLVDLVITLGDFDQSCRPRMPGMPPHLHWDIPEPPAGVREDPASWASRREGFRRARAAIAEELSHLFTRGFLRALFSTRRNFELILDNLLDGVLAHTATRRIFYFNQAAEEITGVSRKEVLGRDCHDVFPGRFCGGDCFFCEGALPATGEAPTKPGHGLVAETVFRRPGGEERLLQMHPAPLMDEEGVDVGAIISFKDITELGALRRQARQQSSLSGIVGHDPKMLALFELIREVGSVPVSVLIEGESGTGKEVVASAIHAVSPRAERPFVAVNCGSLPEGLLESELFGHVRGAFTGAVRDKKGRFELAQGGTIFLDEVSEISPQMQVTLLRALQEREVQPVGGERSIPVDVRVISATNRNLRSLMEQGLFRPDLFYRLCVVPMSLPPLRERRLDIPLLAGHFLELVARETGRKPLDISPDALDRLTRYGWPGNVRELRNALEYAYVKCHGEIIEPAHLPPEIRSPGARGPILARGEVRDLTDMATPVGDDPRGGTAEPGLSGDHRTDARTGRVSGASGVSGVSGVGRVSGASGVSGVSGVGRVNGVSGVGRVSGESGVSGVSGVGRVSRAEAAPRLSREDVLTAITRAGGNRKRAAALLGVGRATLYRYIERYGL